jgi:alkylhydroperoxidase family enzyme
MTVRTAAVRGEVSKREAECQKHQPKAGDSLNEREAMAVSLAERVALDPHTVTDEFFSDLENVFSEEEIVEMVFACGIFNWGNKFNITMHMDSDSDSEYASDMAYRQEAIS